MAPFTRWHSRPTRPKPGQKSAEDQMDEALRERIKSTIESHRVVLFMKGNKNFPQCGFSAQVIGLLKQNGAEFRDVNILADADLRTGLKEYSNWPTFPQLYVDGQLIGGCDIVTSLNESGELKTLLGAKASGALLAGARQRERTRGCQRRPRGSVRIAKGKG